MARARDAIFRAVMLYVSVHGSPLPGWVRQPLKIGLAHIISEETVPNHLANTMHRTQQILFEHKLSYAVVLIVVRHVGVDNFPS